MNINMNRVEYIAGKINQRLGSLIALSIYSLFEHAFFL